MLLVLGEAREEIVVDLTAPPPPGGQGVAHIERRRNGRAANVAAFAGAVGAPVRFAGQVGDDHTGTYLTDELRSHGVDVRAGRQGSSSTTVVVRSRGQATSLVDQAASTQCTSFDPALLDGVRLVHVALTTLTVEPLASAVEGLLGEAVERRIPVSLDAAGVATIEEYGADQLRAFAEQLHPLVFFCNRDESEHLGLGGRDPLKGATYTVVTAGPRPVLLVPSAGASRVFGVNPVNDIVDRDGVGDAFVTGYLLAHLAGQRPATCVRAGSLLASRVLQHHGPRLGGAAHDGASALSGLVSLSTKRMPE